jgi:hypothetical protein
MTVTVKRDNVFARGGDHGRASVRLCGQERKSTRETRDPGHGVWGVDFRTARGNGEVVRKGSYTGHVAWPTRAYLVGG